MMRNTIIKIFAAIIFLFSCNKENEPLVYNLSERGSQKISICIYLDTDGHTFYSGCEITSQELQEVIDTAKTYLSGKDVTITTDESIYNSFQVGKRQRVLLTNSEVGNIGWSQCNSLIDGQEQNPVLIWYYGALNNIAPINYKRQLSRVIVHEVVHTLGICYHSRTGLMKGFPYPTPISPDPPFNPGDVFFERDIKRYLDKILKPL